jgi:hypothetical protein
MRHIYVTLARGYILEEFSSSIIRMRRIDELGTLAVTSNRRTPRTIMQYHGWNKFAISDSLR